MVAFLAAAAAAGVIGTALGTSTQIAANKDALKAQKKVAELELRQAKQRARIEDRQTVKSIDLADRQLVEGQTISDRQAVGAIGLSDRQAVASIEIADRQQQARFNQLEFQAAEAAAEDRESLKSELQTSNLNAAQRALDIRRSLMSVLGEQRATLAARGVGNGSLSGMFADDANAAATDDFNANRINRLQGEADFAAGTRAVNAGLRNLRSSNLLTAQQSREGALASLGNERESAAASLANDREGAATQLRQIREKAATELEFLRFSTKTDLKNQQEAAKLGIANAKDQTRYANTAALISGFTQIASLGYSAGTQFQRIEPSPRPAAAYQSPRSFTNPQASRSGF